jgi:hypothetical protein
MLSDEAQQTTMRLILKQARRQQQLLLTVTPDEVLRHPRMTLTAPDRPAFVQQPP